MSLDQIEGRIANALVSNATAYSLAKQRVAALEQLLRMIRECSTESAVHRLVDLSGQINGKCAHCPAPAVVDITLGDPINYSLCQRCADLEEHIHDGCSPGNPEGNAK